MPIHSVVVIQLSKHVVEQGKNPRNSLGLASFTEKEGEAKRISVQLWKKNFLFGHLISQIKTSEISKPRGNAAADANKFL